MKDATEEISFRSYFDPSLKRHCSQSQVSLKHVHYVE